MRYLARLVVVVLVAFASLSCTFCVKVYERDRKADPAPSSPAAPTPIPTPAKHTIQFRALGLAPIASLSYGTAYDGTTETTTRLPWIAELETSRSSIFVFLNGQAPQCGTLRLQIFVDDKLFREASSDGLCGEQITVSGSITFTTTGALQDLGDHPELVPPAVLQLRR